jgi:conjugative relaxase-like TrwC/TraI family protein
VLNITPQCGAEGAKAYFAKADYYSEGQEIVGEWGGKGAVLLGQFGRVDRDVFERLCDNRNPLTNEPLTPITRSGRRVGYDFTWSAPKSVSVVHALTGDEGILTAFRDSIRQTMREMEAEMHARVRKGGAQEDRTTGNMLWAEFLHLTSRPVDGLPCPQLHAHMFCFNATYDGQESTWKAGQFGQIKQDAYYWQAVQQSRFASALQSQGYAVRRTKDAFEIVGVPDATLKKFSLRTSVIDRVAEELGITDPARKAGPAATTREAKQPEIPYPDLVTRWDGMLQPAERTALGEVRGTGIITKDRSAAHLDYAKSHVFERTSVIAERRLLTEALRHGVGEATPETMRQAAASGGLLSRVEDGTRWVTTPEVLAEERAMLEFASGGRGACRPLVTKLPELSDQRLRTHFTII